MKDCIRLSAALLLIVTFAASQQPASSEPENQYGPSFASLAWNLFLKVMTPANGSLTFETWTEQCQLSPGMVGCPAAKAGGNGKARLLHGSALARKMAARTAAR